MRGARRWPRGRRRSSRGETGRAEEMAAESAGVLEAAAAKAAVAEELAEGTRRAAAEAASERERNLKDELAAAVAAVIERAPPSRSWKLPPPTPSLRRENRRQTRVELIAATQAKTDANAAAAAAAEAATTSRRLENALQRAERELKAMEEAMLQELTSSEVKLMESTEEAGSRADQLDKIRRELLVERERANLAMNEAKVQEARAASAEAEKETALAWQTGPDGEATGGADPAEVEELRRKIEELELTLAEVMTHGTESTVGDRATGKLMQHMQALQEKVREGRELKALSQTMLAEQALLREQAEEAKFYMTEAEAKANEYEELATKLWGHLDRAGIDVEANVERPKKRERPRFVSGLTITQGGRQTRPGGGGDPAQAPASRRRLVGAHERNHERHGAGGDGAGARGVGCGQTRGGRSPTPAGRAPEGTVNPTRNPSRDRKKFHQRI